MACLGVALSGDRTDWMTNVSSRRRKAPCSLGGCLKSVDSIAGLAFSFTSGVGVDFGCVAFGC